MDPISLLIKLALVVFVLGLGYVAIEVGLYLKWAVDRSPAQETSYSQYKKESEGGLIARYCG